MLICGFLTYEGESNIHTKGFKMQICPSVLTRKENLPYYMYMMVF